jgi:chemotaxis protein MotB
MQQPSTAFSTFDGLAVACVFAVFGPILFSCGVPHEKHKAAVRDLQQTQIELAKARSRSLQLQTQNRAESTALQSRIAAYQKRLEQLKKDLKRTRGTLALYESKTGGLEQKLDTTRRELQKLRQKRQETRRRLQRYRNLAQKFASMVEAGQLEVKIRDGKMVLQLSNDILFESGETAIQGDGKEALKELAGVLSDIEKRRFLIAGHTDNVPIKSGRYDSNWELSTARAVEVVRFLQKKGLSPERMAAAGYSQYDPVATNDTVEGRAKNRRIEVIVMPNLDELPTIPRDILKDLSG